MKTCCTCHTPQPESNFHRNTHSEDGLAAACKDCARARSNRWYRQHNKVKIKPIPPRGHYYCSKCQQVKPTSSFYAGQAYCKDCQRSYSKSRYRKKVSNFYKRVMTDPHIMAEIEAECSKRRMSEDTYEQILAEAKQSKPDTREYHNLDWYKQQAEKLVLRPEDIPEEAPDLY